ncbi:L,D-transpeptidase-like protein [Streptomyces sp. 1114.5]|uniref:L,D-transpeptidase n=1 Tax=unclassified Streptomyces TaxID=2593676 RepID=UPI000BD1790C|nr:MULTISPECIES: Ig-like domain-containing protein [unclassified Streptomyces]RKT18343.1 L,D-transpeptidase-like protein [Streptomyces sp. 1114.5]SOB84536.1 L,D-transpeptidase catalytic domain [Streptomyces sp. 1331.2]
MADRRGIAGIGSISLALVVLAPLAACSSGDDESAGPHRIDAAPLVHLSADGKVDPSQPVTVTAVAGSRLTDVTVVGPDGRVVAGTLADDQRSWQTTGRLKAATAYSVRISADDGKGGRGDTTASFSTLAAQRLLTAKLGPDSSGSGVYGVGQPLTVQLSEAVKDPQARQEVERDLTVSSQPAVTGAWYWVDDKNLHFRPEDYWPAGTTVSLSFDGTGSRIADGLYGGDRSALKLRIGARVESVIDAAAHELTLKRDGEVVRTIPVTTGKPGFDTRNGTKVVLGQERSVRMNGETIGIATGSSEAYDLNVEWATRVTWSGEYVHAAPWSVSSQGVENVSHGCTGMSTDNAKWFYDNTRVGDLVTVVNSRGPQMEAFGNGFGDWNVGWTDWVKHSAVGQPLSTTAPPAQAPASGMIRPEV